MKMTTISGAALAAAAATFVIAGVATAPTAVQAAGDYKVKCYGVNACKGTGSCKSLSSGCKGQNACKGQGIKMMRKSACVAKGGSTSHG